VARTIVLMWALRFLYLCGVDPVRLHRWYYGPASSPAPDETRPAPMSFPEPPVRPD
jgi:hypothetical protein